MNLQYKSFSSEFEVKADSAQIGTFKGYASTFGNVDRGDDVMVKGAFGNVDPKKIKLLWQHKMAEPIGVWTTLREDEKGLYAEGKLALKTRRGEEAYELMKMGALSDMSIGFNTLESEKGRVSDAKRGVREIRKIKRVRLMEVSLVTIPMNAQATIDAVKTWSDAGYVDLSFLDRQEIVVDLSPFNHAVTVDVKHLLRRR